MSSIDGVYKKLIKKSNILLRFTIKKIFMRTTIVLMFFI